MIAMARRGDGLRSCDHCDLAKFNLGLDSLSHLCRCACVQDFYDFESFEQEHHDREFFTKHRMAFRTSLPFVMRNR